MTVIDYTSLKTKFIITHHIGNKLRDEKYLLSSEMSDIEDRTHDFLLKYFLQPIKNEEFYSFTHPIELSMNEVNILIKKIFTDEKSFIKNTQNIAKLLYDQSMHPRIKEGELNIVYFTNVLVNDKILDAVGIFKSEKNVPYIKMEKLQTKFNINHDYGFEIKGIDKGCVIFNMNADLGYRILIFDNSSKSEEAQYWKDNFLQVQPISDQYHQTKEFLDLTKNFITKQLGDESNVDKTHQIDMLNRSVEYFKSHSNLSKSDFEKEIFQDEEIIQSFRDFDKTYTENSQIQLPDNFEISSIAVKKQARIFKKVLKLDKNFDIYIHGDSELIERGVDANGRKYYKIYYKEEA